MAPSSGLQTHALTNEHTLTHNNKAILKVHMRKENGYLSFPVIEQAQMSTIVTSTRQAGESLVWWLQASGSIWDNSLNTASGTVTGNNHFGDQLSSITEAEHESTHHPPVARLDKHLVC